MLATYTGYVEGKHAVSELAALLRRLRDERGRMSRSQLAQNAGLSLEPIKSIETEGHVPKPSTLRQIANGLAAYAPGRRDKELADSYYLRLMTAAGYVAPSHGQGDKALQPVPERSPLQAEIAALLAQIPDATIALTSLARGSDDWDDEDREYVLGQLRRLARRYGRTQTSG